MSVAIDYNRDFDPGHLLKIAALSAIRPPQGPTDFDAFWETRYARALGIEPQPQLRDSASSHPDWVVHDITYTSTDGFPISGWLLLPRNGTVRRGLVVGHGYGGRDGPDFDMPVTDTAVLFPCLRGLSRSSRAPISGDAAWHVLHDIDDRERYILGGCVDDLWVAVSVLSGLYPAIAGRIGYSGISFGGGIGALAMAFDRRIDRGNLIVPTFGNMPIWLNWPSTGSANSVQNYRKTHPDVLDTLRFFDAAVAASRIAVPMLVAVARFDPAVAPPCQFSIANALPTSNDHQIVILDGGHCDYPGQEEQHAALFEQVRRFFGHEAGVPALA
jgi:cephalosporin-C deacetylase